MAAVEEPHIDASSAAKFECYNIDMLITQGRRRIIKEKKKKKRRRKRRK